MGYAVMRTPPVRGLEELTREKLYGVEEREVEVMGLQAGLAWVLVDHAHSWEVEGGEVDAAQVGSATAPHRRKMLREPVESVAERSTAASGAKSKPAKPQAVEL